MFLEVDAPTSGSRCLQCLESFRFEAAPGLSSPKTSEEWSKLLLQFDKENNFNNRIQSCYERIIYEMIIRDIFCGYKNTGGLMKIYTQSS